MSAAIDLSNGRENMAYVGSKPWHGLGNLLTPGASLETWRAEAGMDFTILETPATFTDQNGISREFSSRRVFFREDTGEGLGLHSDRYKVVQPATIVEFFRDLCDNMGYSLETAGCLGHGQKYWALAKLNKSAEITPGDTVEAYMLLATACDGTMATVASPTSIRVVCNNTLGMALRSASKKLVKVRHTSTFDPDTVKASLGLVDTEATFTSHVSTLRQLSDTPVSDKEAAAFLTNLLRPVVGGGKADSFAGLLSAVTSETESKGDSWRAARGMEPLCSSYLSAPGAVPGTAYGLIQAVTHYTDHARGTSADKRLQSSWFGQGQRMKDQAMELACLYAGIVEESAQVATDGSSILSDMLS